MILLANDRVYPCNLVLLIFTVICLSIHFWFDWLCQTLFQNIPILFIKEKFASSLSVITLFWKSTILSTQTLKVLTIHFNLICRAFSHIKYEICGANNSETWKQKKRIEDLLILWEPWHHLLLLIINFKNLQLS